MTDQRPRDPAAPGPEPAPVRRRAIVRAIHRFSATPFGGRALIRVVTPIDRLLMRRTRGRLGLAVGHDTLLLRTLGARSGELREVPLLYVPDGDRFVVVASRGGSERTPAWLRNLRAHPHATVDVGGSRVAVRAHEAEGAEREGLWRRANAAYAGYAAYQRRVRRRIPVVVLTPVERVAATSPAAATGDHRGAG